MKRIISFLTSVILCLQILPTSVFAKADSETYSEEIETLIFNYSYNARMIDALYVNGTVDAYTELIHNVEDNNVLSWLIERSSYVIDELPDKQDYVEILTNLMIMQSGDLSEQIQAQSQFDDLKTGLDYTFDFIDAVDGIDALITSIGGESLSKELSPIIDAISGGIGVLIENTEQAKYYQSVIQDFSQSKQFLSAVSKYAENKELRDAAKDLLSLNQTLLEKRLEYLSDTAATLAEYEASFYMKNLHYELLKSTDLYSEDETVKWFVDLGESISATWSAGEFVFDMMMLAGNVGFGTSNMFNRYQEMRIISDIAHAIEKANSKIIISEADDFENVLPDIAQKSRFYKMLLTAHARGDYLLYNLLMNDAGVLSDFRYIFEYFQDDKEKTTTEVYQEQVESIMEYYSELSEILNDISVITQIQNNQLSKQEQPKSDAATLPSEQENRIHTATTPYTPQFYVLSQFNHASEHIDGTYLGTVSRTYGTVYSSYSECITNGELGIIFEKRGDYNGDKEADAIAAVIQEENQSIGIRYCYTSGNNIKWFSPFVSLGKKYYCHINIIGSYLFVAVQVEYASGVYNGYYYPVYSHDIYNEIAVVDDISYSEFIFVYDLSDNCKEVLKSERKIFHYVNGDERVHISIDLNGNSYTYLEHAVSITGSIPVSTESEAMGLISNALSKMHIIGVSLLPAEWFSRWNSIKVSGQEGNYTNLTVVKTPGAIISDTDVEGHIQISGKYNFNHAQ